jgi:hypothetical protein
MRFSTRSRVESNAGRGNFVVGHVDPASGAACLQPVASTRRFPVTLFCGPINSRYWKTKFPIIGPREFAVSL